MWFNNALIFSCELPKDCQLNEALFDSKLKPCPPHARNTHGWLPAYQDEMVHVVAGCMLICMGKEERILPKAVTQKALDEKVKAYETEHGRKMKRADKAQLSEELEFELLPKSFCIQKKQYAFIDSLTNHIVINSSSPSQSGQLLALLRKSVPGIVIEPLQYSDNLALRFKQWIESPQSLPTHIQLASDCLLFSLDNEKKKFNCKGYELPANEVLNLLEQNMAVSELSLTWNERIQFSLTENFCLKKLKCLDLLIDDFQEAKSHAEEYEQQDAALALLSGEFRSLLNDLLPLTEDINQAKSSNRDIKITELA